MEFKRPPRHCFEVRPASPSFGSLPLSRNHQWIGHCLDIRRPRQSSPAAETPLHPLTTQHPGETAFPRGLAGPPPRLRGHYQWRALSTRNSSVRIVNQSGASKYPASDFYRNEKPNTRPQRTILEASGTAKAHNATRDISVLNVPASCLRGVQRFPARVCSGAGATRI